MKEILFKITIKQIQELAIEKLGRTLNNVELYQVKKGLESGVLFDFETVIESIFEEIN